MKFSKKFFLAGVVIVVLYLTVLKIWADKEMEDFGNKSKEQKLDYLSNSTAEYNDKTELVVEYFTRNWDKEGDEVKAGFCEFVKVFRTQKAISLLADNMEFVYFSVHVERSRVITEGRVALEALIQIGVPALEPSFERACAKLNDLAYDENTRFRVVFLEETLKYLPLKILGKKLAQSFLEDKMKSDKLSDKLKQYIAKALTELENEK